MVEFVKIWHKREVAAIEADFLCVFTEKGEKPNSSLQASPPARDSALTMSEGNAPFISPERKVEFSEV